MRGAVALGGGLIVLVLTAGVALAAPGEDIIGVVKGAAKSLPGEKEANHVVENVVAEGARAAPLPAELPAVPVDIGGADVVTLAILIGASVATAFLVLGGARYVTRDEVLVNPVRARIYEYVRTRVGANLKQITDDLALTTTNAIWHLRKLEDAGLIHSRRFNGFKVFYPAEGGIEARRLSLSMTALANENAQEVFEFVVAHPGSHQREIARALGVNHGTVRWHLKKLRSAELLTELKRGKASAYYATEVGNQALAARVSATPGPLVVPIPVAR